MGTMNETLQKKNSNEVEHIFMHLIEKIKIKIIVILCHCTSKVIFLPVPRVDKDMKQREIFISC